ncbi:hypothetical protein [uncultured Chryseobacterium sp.]|uniref:hypothetical protein n=1 Tax=uncultured Chryseobacterium sp. TaxID=259322 RepID=UPI0025DAE865|nr:hypothetical protein [uncultured Chryseobacterium sp.]
MSIDIGEIKYYPDRFYIKLDGFNTENLTTFLTDLEIGQDHAIFIHEYYHYLTNIATLPGIRQFSLNFCDRFRTLTILTMNEGLNAFPISKNTYKSCEDLVKYWNNTIKILNEDDINYEVVNETKNALNNKFEIVSIEQEIVPVDLKIEGKSINGCRIFIKINIVGLLNIHNFRLTFGAMDEFLSSAIDEFLYEHDLSDIDPSLLSKRPFYPYLFFDELLSFYGIKRSTSFEKIVLVYFALNSANPPSTLITILEKLRDGDYDQFTENPEVYLLSNFSEAPQYKNVLESIKLFAEETYQQDRVHISQALKYYYDKFYIASKLKDDDFFFFIRPFFPFDTTDNFRFKQRFLLELSRIVNIFTPPVILKDKKFRYIDKLTSFGEATALIIATYEIFESLNTNRIATRPKHQKVKYLFPDYDPECDNIAKFTDLPIYGIVFRIALNELGLYQRYLNEQKAKNK